ncbi:MAG TPA: HXXEE domain-containing protein [Edaphocola sp.]|nr:HXXEE domain-containing protein [Edaphocola sp.]
MKFLRNHWYDLGALLAIGTGIYIWKNFPTLSDYQLLMWLSLIALFIHQLEEYRIVGTFPGMINTAMFKSSMPDRYPLNTNTSLIINVWVGWVIYFLAAIFAENCIWLGIASILVYLGNIIAHTFIFNIKGKTIYNAGMASSWICLAPCVFCFFKIIWEENLASTFDYLLGIILGITLNIFVIAGIKIWAKKNTKYNFPKRNLLAIDRR